MDQDNYQENILDVTKLNETFMSDSDIIKQILSAFQETAASFEEDFKTLGRAKNKEELSRLVHGLKGSSANIRAGNVARQSAHIQQLIDQNKDYSSEAAELFDSLSQLNDQIIKFKAG
tara:strand:- start:18003 stop:18356 length:354 start_codon:yes stop_codon:yes gene_type:complete